MKRKYAAFHYWHHKKIQEWGIISDLIEGMSFNGKQLFHSPISHTPDPPDCIVQDTEGNRIAVEISELVSQEAIEQNIKGNEVYYDWQPKECIEKVQSILDNKDTKVFHGEPYSKKVILIHTDEPILRGKEYKEEIRNSLFNPLKQIDEAYILFSYDPEIGTHPFIKLNFEKKIQPFDGEEYGIGMEKTMKKLVILFLTSLIFGCAAGGIMSTTMTNIPTEFRGITYGTDIKTVQDVVIEFQDGDMIKCTRQNEQMKFAGADVENIYYYFYKGKFYEGRSFFKGRNNFVELREILQKLYGPSLEQKSSALGLMGGQLSGTVHLLPESQKEVFSWYGETIYVKLEYFSGEGSLIYQYIPILKKSMQ